MSIRFTLATAVALALGAGCASAETITVFTQTYNQTAFDAQGNLTIALPQFTIPDPGAQLAAATITLEGVAGPQFEVLNLGSAPATGVGTTINNFVLTGNGVTLTENASSGTQTVVVPGGLFNIASSNPVLVPFVVSQNATNLSAFIGSGDVDFVLNNSFSSSGSITSGSGGVGGTGSSNFAIFITYDVPEPASLAVLGAGLLGLVAVGRRGLRR